MFIRCCAAEVVQKDEGTIIEQQFLPQIHFFSSYTFCLRDAPIKFGIERDATYKLFSISRDRFYDETSIARRRYRKKK